MSHNRLANETSPYLLQHKDNPVHWWAWGPEALAEAKRLNKPILLSVGYSACHWCHVMAHESFEDLATARVMNELFVNIKIDREERPDIDAIYMNALHSLGQQGGWPLTMFLDSDARPFWGGTYFPKTAMWGRPPFVHVLMQVAEVFHNEPGKVRNNAEAITAALAAQTPGTGDGADIGDAFLADLVQRLAGAVDPQSGGLRGAPKFPQWSVFWLLWRGAIRYDNESAKAAVITTLRNICQGGIYDHLGGGFARYSVDERWLVPHFEKMLYDNALLIELLTEVWRETQEPLFKVRIAETVAWLEREMIAENGAFAASLDADSEGEEGRFYVWTADEIATVLGRDDAAIFARIYNVTAAGNWEDHVILNRLDNLGLGDAAAEARLAGLRAKLLAHRAGRIRPGWDDKVLADWNGLMIASLARAAVIFEQPAWLALAAQAFEAVDDKLGDGNRLWHSYRLGQRRGMGVAADYANMVWAAIRLFEATGKSRYLDRAIAWTAALRSTHRTSSGSIATAAADATDVIVRLADARDDAVPNANGVMVANLMALHALTGEETFATDALAIAKAFAAAAAAQPTSHCGFLAATLDLAGVTLCAIVGPATPASSVLSQISRELSLPGALLWLRPPSAAEHAIPALKGKLATDIAQAYLCTSAACSAPIKDPIKLKAVLLSARRSTV